jgi:hypothetical protein
MTETGTLDVDEFERAWGNSPPADAPHWHDFLPGDVTACHPDLLVYFLETDIEHRIRSGRTAILTERYWEHPRLTGALAHAHVVELVQRELANRRRMEPGCSTEEYRAAFPELRDILKGIEMAKSIDPSTVNPPSLAEPYPMNSEVNVTHEVTETLQPDIDDDSAMLVPPQAAGEIGRLAHYRILRRLGAGGMGVVYEAEDTHLARSVALTHRHDLSSG